MRLGVDAPGVAASASPACLACAGTGHRVLHQLRSYRLLQCARCTLVWIDPLPEPAVLLALADEAHRGNPFEDMDEYFVAPALDDRTHPLAQAHRALLAQLARWTDGRRLLDIGCGTGYFAALAQADGWSPLALDSSPAATAQVHAVYGLETATSAFPDPDVIHERFDAITLLDVLEHLPDPWAAIVRARALLAPGGVLVVNSPNHASLLCWAIDHLGRLDLPPLRRRLEQYYHRAHVTVFSPQSLSLLLALAGLSIVATGQSSPLIDRFALSPTLAFAVRSLERLGRWTNAQSRCWVAARRPPTG